MLNAEKGLLQLVNSGIRIPDGYKAFIYNNLGVTSTFLRRYPDALNYFSLAEKSLYTRADSSSYLSDIYVNKALIYGNLKSYPVAIDYFEKGIRIYMRNKNPDRRIINNISTAYLDFGVILFEVGEFGTALGYFEKSKEIKLKFNLSEIALADFNIARTYVKLSRFNEAEKFFKESIDRFISEFGPDYYRLSVVYLEYGQFLYDSGRHHESLETLNKALPICLKNFGEKHSRTSSSYKIIGDYYKNQSDYNSALKYYQRSLISVVEDFNDTNVFSNPSIDSSLHDIRLLDNLKSKAEALELLSGGQANKEVKAGILNKSFETIELALKLADRIRNSYFDEETRIYLAENDKDTWLSAIHIANSLYAQTGDNSVIQTMYSFVRRAKATVLRNAISENELLLSSSVPDSLIKKLNTLAGDIGAYEKQILEESKRVHPDSISISVWKDALFGLNRMKEKVSDEIMKLFPRYHDLLLKTEPLQLSEIQKKLERNETVIDYMLSNRYSEGKRKLYIFVITHKNLKFRETSLDSAFSRNADIIRNGDDPALYKRDRKAVFTNYTNALNYMYETLFKPIEDIAEGKRIIIVPDEEIAWLPFDAFLRELPQSGQSDYEGLRYLVYDYAFTYAFSSSLIFSSNSGVKKGEGVLAFSPDYGNSDFAGANIGELKGAANEIGSIYKWFNGRRYNGNQATETNFRNALHDTAIFHLAMHSVSDTTNSKYSFLLFDSKNDSANDGRLYNYEISLMRIVSPMVVLSACNSEIGRAHV
jgi:tetratricopeptide (TPR) repeat protein